MKKLAVNLKKEIDLSYHISVERGMLKQIYRYLNGGKNFLITNKTLAKLYPDFLKNFDKENIIIINDGEKYKNLRTIEYIWKSLLLKKIERKDTVVAFGGGVVGDLAGFCASTILRGVDFIQIPTTLLAQVDSSVGGKTGFNNSYGKNLVGTFYQPMKVLIDPDVLKTLPQSDFISGLGEVVKYAFIEKSCGAKREINLFKILEEHDKDSICDVIDDVILACAELKAAVVEQDEKETGLRKILNLGHTYAHAFEKITNYKLPHGQAVAEGVKSALKLSLMKGFIDVDYYNYGAKIINKYRLNKDDIKFPTRKALNIMRSDKKVKNSKINLILPRPDARVELFDDIDEPLIEGSLL